ncbi:CHC2 zinc finger domain-containing protein [uncultured Pedobacter sp.]|uniref:CHC2 zinc finger domain-containing protein n=1 Tax=uncultured Pedobacter sp. TaxID=246139 RepID=UPI00345C1FCF
MIPKFIIEEVRKTEISTLISEFMPLEQQGTQLVGTCPFCHQSKFMVSQSKNIFKYFTCQKGGGTDTFCATDISQIFYRCCPFFGSKVGD